MNLKLGFIIIIISLVSCKDFDKYQFINCFLKDPENIEVCLKQAKFKTQKKYWDFLSDTNYAKQENLNFSQYFKNGYKIFLDNIHDIHVGASPMHKDSVLREHLIIIKGDSNFLLEFSWYYSYQDSNWYYMGHQRYHNLKIK